MSYIRKIIMFWHCLNIQSQKLKLDMKQKSISFQRSKRRIAWAALRTCLMGGGQLPGTLERALARDTPETWPLACAAPREPGGLGEATGPQLPGLCSWSRSVQITGADLFQGKGKAQFLTSTKFCLKQTHSRLTNTTNHRNHFSNV